MQTIALHHILIKSPLLAEDIAKELELGADFAELAREYSACPSAKEGGFAGYHHQDDLPLAVITALAKCQEGKIFTGPVKSQFGYHLLKPVGEKPKLAISDDDFEEQSMPPEPGSEVTSDQTAETSELKEEEAAS